MAWVGRRRLAGRHR